MASKKEAYLFLSAMLRAREPKLLNRDRAERMIDASGFEEAAKLLTDCGYEDMSQMTAGEIDSALAAHRAEIFAELERMAADKGITDVFKLKYDYHNAKTLIKAEAMNTDAAYLLSASGRYSPEYLTAAYTEDRCRTALPDILAGAIAEAKSAIARTGNPQLADFILDKAYFEELKRASESLNSSFLAGYAAVLIDSANLRSAVRTMRMGKDNTFLQDALIAGGNVGKERILAAADKDSLAALFAHSVLEKAALLGADAASGGTMTEFELACDNAVNKYLGGARLVAYGEEPVIAYMAAIEGEITAVRMILTGRLAGIKAEVIKERLRDFYA